jgi:DNA (cytosine-5)-methyltransferase 1
MGKRMIDVNLFGGPGGTCLGAAMHGLDPIGIELDEWACKTRRAAGLQTTNRTYARLRSDEA